MMMPEFPGAVGYLWRVYHRLRRRIGAGFAGPNPITWQDIDAFVRRTGLSLAPWEIEAIEGIDDAFLNPAIRAAGKTASAQNEMSDMVSMNDPKAVRSLLRSFGKRRSRKKGG